MGLRSFGGDSAAMIVRVRIECFGVARWSAPTFGALVMLTDARANLANIELSVV